MLKTFTIAAIALGTAAAIPPLHAQEFLGRQGVQLNGPELMGLSTNGPELMGLLTNGPSLGGQVGPLAPDEAGMRVVALRRPTAAK
jgi:hypothetical protein